MGVGRLVLGRCLLLVLSLCMMTGGMALAGAPAAALGDATCNLSAGALTVSNPSPGAGEQVALTLDVLGTPPAEAVEAFRGVVIDAESPLSGRGVNAPYILGSVESGYTMWYAGISDDNVRRIFRATSPDGLAWTELGVSMERPYPNECLFPCVLDNGDGTMSMWFTNLNYRYTIMRATSFDGGATWSSPVLEMTYGEWYDLDGVKTSRVVYDDGEYRMWYVGGVWATPTTSAETRICHAHKTNLNDPWVKDGVVLDRTPEFASAKDPCVSVSEEGYEMFYSATKTVKIYGIYRIVYGEVRHAASPDGMAWTSDPEPVLVPELPEEGVCVHMPFPVPDGGLYYVGYIGYDAGIGLQRIMYVGERTTVDEVDAVCSVSFAVDGEHVGTVDGLLVPAGGTAQASVDWVATPGSHTVVATIHSVSPSDADGTDNAASILISVQEPGEAKLNITKVLVSGPIEGVTHTYYEWEMLITVMNAGGATASGIVVSDVIPAELAVMNHNASVGTVMFLDPYPHEIYPITGLTTKGAPFAVNPAIDSGHIGVRDVRTPAPSAAPSPPKLEPVRSTHVTWRIGSLAPGESAMLSLTVCTRVNPGGNQEFTSAGTYVLNDGATVSGTDYLTGLPLFAGPTPSITVQIS